MIIIHSFSIWVGVASLSREGLHCYDYERKKWKKLETYGTIGYKRIINIRPGNYSKVKFVFKEFREFFEISYIAIN